MKKYKFYSLTDKDEDTIYIFDASNIEEAYVLASQIKKLPLEDFKKIFKVERNRDENNKEVNSNR